MLMVEVTQYKQILLTGSFSLLMALNVSEFGFLD